MKKFLFTLIGDEQNDMNIPDKNYQKVPKKDIIESDYFKESINLFAKKNNLRYEWEYHQDTNIGDELTFYNNTNGSCVFYTTKLLGI